MTDPIETFKEADRLVANGQDVEAAHLYLSLLQIPQLGALAHYRLGQVYNRFAQIVDREEHIATSQRYHTQAFELMPQLATLLVQEDHPAHSYTYTTPEETDIRHCTLCGEEGKPHYCVNTVVGLDFIPGFNPVRLWMYCENCHHLFANNYPHNLGELLSESAFEFNLKPELSYLKVYGDIMNVLTQFTPGNRLLEVGVGAGELLAVAKEYQFDAMGLDIRPAYSAAVSKLLNIPVVAEDFQKFETDQLFDVICMGDVIEHMTDPIQALQKANSLLNEKGVLWISTPTFESAYIQLRKDQDPMWTVIEHLQYFSAESLRKALEMCGFEPLTYAMSKHYAGSMEMIAVKK